MEEIELTPDQEDALERAADARAARKAAERDSGNLPPGVQSPPAPPPGDEYE